MRTRLMMQTTSYLVAVTLVFCSFTASAAIAGPRQTTSPTTASAHADVIKSADNHPVLARAGSPKGSETPGTSSTKNVKKQNKKTIGRCWNRLMAMVREARQAHHSRK